MQMRYIVEHMFAALCALVLLFMLAACGSNEPVSSKPAYVSPYEWSGLTSVDGRFSYSEAGNVISKTGIDVSEHQGTIDWDAVANDGIDFAMIRLGNRGSTEGGIYLDEEFRTNLEGAENAGLDVGVYFFSQALNENEAREEAAFVIEQLGGEGLDYPVVFDQEPMDSGNGRADRITGTQLTANAKTFCEAVKQAGYEPMIYCNKRDSYKFDMDELPYRFWYAEYNELPSGQFDFGMWQYTTDGRVSGIAGSADMNILLSTER